MLSGSREKASRSAYTDYLLVGITIRAGNCSAREFWIRRKSDVRLHPKRPSAMEPEAGQWVPLLNI